MEGGAVDLLRIPESGASGGLLCQFGRWLGVFVILCDFSVISFAGMGSCAFLCVLLRVGDSLIECGPSPLRRATREQFSIRRNIF